MRYAVVAIMVMKGGVMNDWWRLWRRPWRCNKVVETAGGQRCCVQEAQKPIIPLESFEYTFLDCLHYELHT